MRLALCLLAVALLVSPAFAAERNAGTPTPPVFAGHVITPPSLTGSVLYAPSEADDPGFRSLIATAISGTCDYYDTRYGTPDATLLARYTCVMTWANYAYQNNVLFGNNLADFVDAGGTVVLGAFCAYTAGNYLSGRIMTDTARYCPVRGGFNHFSTAYWDGTCATDCIYLGVTSWSAYFRDYLTLVAADGAICGRFTDGEIATAINFNRDVFYVNGSGAVPGFGYDPAIARVVGQACVCSTPTATEPSTWGTIKDMYR